MKYFNYVDDHLMANILQNEKTGHFHNIIVPNVYIRIYPDGGVLYSIRLVQCSVQCPVSSVFIECNSGVIDALQLWVI